MLAHFVSFLNTDDWFMLLNYPQISEDQMHPNTTEQQPMEDQPSPPKHTCTGELELKAVTPNGTVIWKIPDITRQRSEAIEGKTQCLYSPYFYTEWWV